MSEGKHIPKEVTLCQQISSIMHFGLVLFRQDVLVGFICV